MIFSGIKTVLFQENSMKVFGRMILFGLFFLNFSLRLFAQTNTDSLEISGLRILVVNSPRQDEVFLDLSPGHDTVAVSKLDNPGITIALGTNLKRYAIAGLAVVEEAGIVPLNIRRAGSLNLMKLKKTGPEMGFYVIFLKDDALGEIYPLSNDSTEIEFSTFGNDSDRFSLLIQSSATKAADFPLSNKQICPPPLSSQINIDPMDAGRQMDIYDTKGRKVYSAISDSGILNLPTFAAGLYLLVLEGSKKSCLLVR
jgi:hypothetical protein